MRHHYRYLRQCLRWQWFVLRAGLHTGAPVWRLVAHDLGRLRPTVWGPFARFLYGPTANPQQWMERWLKRKYGVSVLAADAEQEAEAKQAYTAARKQVEIAFLRAQLTLSHANRADWPWWVLRDEKRPSPVALVMPESLARVMVATWIASGRDQTGSWENAGEGVRRFYAHRRQYMMLHANTRKLVERALNEVKDW